MEFKEALEEDLEEEVGEQESATAVFTWGDDVVSSGQPSVEEHAAGQETAEEDAAEELSAYLERTSRRRTGRAADTFVQRILPRGSPRTLMRNRVVQGNPLDLLGLLPRVLQLPSEADPSPTMRWLICDLGGRVRAVTQASGSTVYIVEGDQVVMIHHEGKPELDDSTPENWMVSRYTTVAAFVADTGDYVLRENPVDSFPDGLGWTYDTQVKSALAVPISNADGVCAVIELVKVAPLGFQRSDLVVTLALASCLSCAVSLSASRAAAQHSCELKQRLLDTVTERLSGRLSLLEALAALLDSAKRQLGATTAALFVLHPQDATLADLYREPLDDRTGLVKRDAKVVLPEEAEAVWRCVQGSCPVVVAAVSRELSRGLLPGDAVANSTALCVPLAGNVTPVAVILLANKQFEEFTEEDGLLVKEGCASDLASVLALLTLDNAELPQAELQVRSSTLQHLLKGCSHDRERLDAAGVLERLPKGFQSYSWAPPCESHDDMVRLVVAMAHNLLGGLAVAGPVEEWNHLVLSVRNAYRDVPYHNFHHAVSVCHCVYLILKTNITTFTDMELKALFLAALFIDVDHQGVTNNYLYRTQHTLAKIYPTSPNENHHFQTAKKIAEGIFVYPCTDLKELWEEVHQAILATDLEAYFQTRRRLLRLMSANEFIWNEPKHRRLVKNAIMAAADASVLCKPHPETTRAANLFAEELFLQGDLERERGLTPLPVMDREAALEGGGGGGVVAADVQSYVEAVCAPAAELLTLALPNTKPLLRMCQEASQHWAEQSRRVSG